MKPVDALILRRMYRTTPAERPMCPCCGTRAEYREGAEWIQAYGHRCQHGFPCPSFGKAIGKHGCSHRGCLPTPELYAARYERKLYCLAEEHPDVVPALEPEPKPAPMVLPTQTLEERLAWHRDRHNHKDPDGQADKE